MRADQMPLEADLREKTQHGTESFPFQYYADALYRYDNQFVPQHWHSELEFVIAYGGEIEIQVWNRPVRLKSGEGILINANVLHSYQQIHPEDQCICPNIVFGDGLIAPIASTVHEKYVDPDYSGRNHALYCLGAWDSVAERNTWPIWISSSP